MIGSILNERYRIDEEIGQGGMGAVYRGFDTTLDRQVAIKVLSRSGLGTKGSSQLLDEAQMAAKLNHPNIVTVYDVGEEESTPFIVMEYVEGKSLHEQRPETIPETLGLMRQVCAGLEHAHGHGIIHRDLKPENVVITRDGTAKLMDFGLARSMASRYTTEGMVAGTVFYLAPEQALGQVIDPRTDLYSLGVMMYELTTGELPFADRDPIAVISQHLHAPVVPPRAKNEEIPPGLNDLIVALLSKDPQDRPASVRKVLQSLESLEVQEADTIAVDKLYVLDRIVRGRIVGRERELNQARQLWKNTVSGEGQMLLISGEPGIGKTRLMREIATQAEVSGGQVLVGECQAEGNAPYAPFAQITRRALRANGFELPKHVMADLLVLSPELRVEYPEVELNPKLDPEAEQRRLFENVVRFCDILCQEAPLLLVLEDMHWADSGSLHLLEHLARRTRTKPVMLLGTYREVELNEALPFHEALLGLTRRRLGQRVKLDRLDREKTRDLLAVIFAEEIEPDFLEGIYKETEGNPFFVEEVCKALVESGEVWYEGGEWQRAPKMEDVSVPQGVKVAIQSRVSKLSGETQGILLTAAVIGREFDFQTLNMVTGKDEETLIDGLEETISKQLIEEMSVEGEEQFTFSHALIPATLRESVSGLRRTRLHRQVATAIEELRPEDYERLAYHWGEAGDETRGLEYMIKAAKRAQRAYANEDAVRLYSEAIALLLKDHPERFELLAGRAAVYDVMAEREAQLADVEAMLVIADIGGDDARKVDALLDLAGLYLETETVKAREPLEQALIIARELGDLGREGRALYLFGTLAFFISDSNKAREDFEASIKCFHQVGLKSEMAESLSFLSVVLGDIGDDIAALKAIQEAVDLSNEIDDKQLQARSKRRLAIAYMGQHKYDEALPVAESALEIFNEVGDLTGKLHAQNVVGTVKQHLGRLEEAEKDILVALKIAESIGNDAGIRMMLTNLLEFYSWYLGEPEKALIFVQDQVDKAHLVKSESHSIMLQEDKVYLLNKLGEYQLAYNLAKAILPGYKKIRDVTWQGYFLSALGVFSAKLGQFEQAHQYLEGALEQCSGIKNILTEAAIPSNYAHTALLEGETSLLLDGLERMKRAVIFSREHNFKVGLELGLWYEACLHLALLEEDRSHAGAALECTVEKMDLIQIEPYVWIWQEQCLFLHSRALRANGREEDADEYLSQAYERVMMVAGNINDEDLRRSYLENVRDNREIQAAYQERFG